MDRLTAVSVFVEAVARGSISGAAKHLGMSRAMATRHLALMEDWMGTRLLHRTTRTLSLTPAGEKLLPACQEMRRLAKDFEALSHSETEVLTGLVRITAASIFAEHCLTDLLAEFLDAHPGVSVDLQIVDQRSSLAEDGIDLALRVTNDLPPGLIGRKLGQVHSVICAAPRYLERYGTPVRPEDLRAHHCLTFAHYGRSVWQFDNRGQALDVPVTGNLSSNDASIVHRGAMSGVGVALLPAFAVREQLEDGRLIRVLADYQIRPLALYALYLSRRNMPVQMRALIDFLAQRLADFS